RHPSIATAARPSGRPRRDEQVLRRPCLPHGSIAQPGPAPCDWVAWEGAAAAKSPVGTAAPSGVPEIDTLRRRKLQTRGLRVERMIRAAVFNTYLGTWGGGERSTYAVATALSQLGFDVEVVTFEDRAPNIEEIDAFFGPGHSGFRI